MITDDLMEKYKQEIIDLRRTFHEHPELSFEEVETTKRIAAILDNWGIPYEINPDKHVGLVAKLTGGHPGKAVALRSDIDGLPVLEKTGFPYASQVEGKMHACGHDSHMAMLLGAIRMLMDLKDEIYGDVYFVFQPAEELGVGAKYMMQFGDWFSKIGAIFGGHIWPTVPAGTIGIRVNEFMAAADEFIIRVHGVQAHGSEPWMGVDAVVVGSAIVMNLQSLVSREFNALDPVVITIGTFQSGDRWNIVSGEAELRGTTRYFRKKLSKDIQEKMNRVIQETAKAYGATAEFIYNLAVMPTVNDPECTAIARQAVTEVLGAEAIHENDLVMGGEDFSFYQDQKPGCFVFVGTYNPDCNAVYSNHSNYFTIDETVFAGGSRVYAQMAIDWLAKNR